MQRLCYKIGGVEFDRHGHLGGRQGLMKAAVMLHFMRIVGSSVFGAARL